jgi:AraC-like DNA-binding protein
VETLQTLEIPSSENESVKATTYIPDNIGTLLKERCEDTKYYLQHDITLTQLALVIGTNRTYLSSHFAQQGITYNAYINCLRIEHFISLYRQGEGHATLQQLAQQSGYRSYSTFSNNFKSIMGISLAEWVKGEDTAPMRQ